VKTAIIRIGWGTLDEELITAEVRFSGKVQGVNFRRNASYVSARYGVTGWIRNAEDGTVEACFSGTETSVMEVIRECRDLPGAMVSGSQVRLVNYTDYREFSIKR